MKAQARKTLVAKVQRKYHRLSCEFDERQRRLWAAAEAAEIGYGGVAIVTEATKLARSTIGAGKNDLRRPGRRPAVRRIRAVGGGRKSLVDTQPGLMAALDSLIEPTMRGDPESPLRWTCKSTRKLAGQLCSDGFAISSRKISSLLRETGYSLQGNRKIVEGKQHPDRDAQFEYINAEVERARHDSQPVISVDTKKKELVGNYKNGGKEWYPAGEGQKVKTHDFPDKSVGKAVPYGIYDVQQNEGWVSVGMSADTAEFAVTSIEHWWNSVGSFTYPDATELMITADAGGSNSYRNRLWKSCLQKFADRAQLSINVRHFPPGTSKWNKIEHRMFCQISQNWRGRPLDSHATVVSLIAATTTNTGLTINAVLDRAEYKTGRKISNQEMDTIQLQPASFHGDWNYSIHPAS